MADRRRLKTWQCQDCRREYSVELRTSRVQVLRCQICRGTRTIVARPGRYAWRQVARAMKPVRVEIKPPRFFRSSGFDWSAATTL